MTFEHKLALLSEQSLLGSLKQIKRGIEKEGLRTLQNGKLAQTPHAKALGSALTHPHITTDYSEALLEFITPTQDSVEAAITCLTQTHQFTYQHLDDELIWSASMPCFLEGEESIPIAQYGSSNIGKLKYIYRVGLAHRYGKRMQAIAGIHYNFSLPAHFWTLYREALGETTAPRDFQDVQYFGLIRNFRRFGWLILYLFGASPALCSSFLAGREHNLSELGPHTLYSPYATSLRMGDLGYQNNTQQTLNICYNSLSNYVDTLQHAIGAPHPRYEQIGLKKDGEYRQLNTHILQIENEYYSDIRPKRVTPSGQKPINVIRDEGVEYIEVRSLDINPYLPAGIDAQTGRFVESFLLYCLLEDSPCADEEACARVLVNKARVVQQGRSPNLTLLGERGEERSLSHWASDIFEHLSAVANTLDQAYGLSGDDSYLSAVTAESEKISHPERTPSARILEDMRNDDQTFFDFAMTKTLANRDWLRSAALPEEIQTYFTGVAQESLDKQAEIEAQSSPPFDEFLADYLAQ